MPIAALPAAAKPALSAERATRPVAAAGSAGPLVVRVRNWVGDVVLGLPALRLLQAHGYALHLVSRGKWAPSLLSAYDWPITIQAATLRERVRQLRSIRAACRKQDPGFDSRDNALLLPASLSSALEMRLAGLRAAGIGNEGRSPLLRRVLKPATSGHESARYWTIACNFLGIDTEAPGDLGMLVAPGKVLQAAQSLAAHGIHGRYLLICPFARGLAATAKKSDKKWPGFAAFVARAATELGVPVLVYPGPGEDAEARALYPAAQIVEGADLALYLALLQRAALVVANDTGPGHMAAAVGAPVFSVLGPTIARRWAPYGPTVRVLQHADPDAEDAVDAWPTVDEVLAAAAQQLARQPVPPGG